MIFVQFITIYNKFPEISTLVAGKKLLVKSKTTDLKVHIKTLRFCKGDRIQAWECSKKWIFWQVVINCYKLMNL